MIFSSLIMMEIFHLKFNKKADGDWYIDFRGYPFERSHCWNHIGALLLALLIPTQSFAHAGIFDRYLDYSVSARALFYTTLIVQLFLSVFPFFFLRKTRLLRVVRFSCWRWSQKWYYLLFFIVLVPFLVLTLVDMDYVLMFFLSGGSLLIIVTCYAILSFRLFVSKKRTPSWRRLYILIILTFQQVIGYGVYLLAYKTDIMRHFFFYTDDLYQIGNYTVYPETHLFATHIEGYISMLLLFLCWFVFLILLKAGRKRWNKRKNEKKFSLLINPITTK